MVSYARGGECGPDPSDPSPLSFVRAFMRCVFAMLLIAASSFAVAKESGADRSKTTLTTTADSASCVVFTPGVSSREVPCDASGWTVDLLPGEVAQFVVQFTYTYSDDGLSFSSGVVDVQCNGVPCAFDPGNAAFEFGELRVGVGCGPGCTGGVSYPQYLPLTDGPDSFTLSGSLFQAAGYFSPVAQTLSFNFFADATTVSVTAVPEPGTWLLMALALPLMAGMALRHRSFGS